MKLFFRSLQSLLRRYKTAVLLNLFGLTVAFAACLLIGMQMDYEMTYNSYHRKSDRTFRLEGTYEDLEHLGVHSIPFIKAFAKSSPHITDYTMLFPLKSNQDIYLIPDEAGLKREGFKEKIAFCYPDIVRVFDFRLIEGDSCCLQIPGQVLIPQSMAKKMFGKESAIGKRLHTEGYLWGLVSEATFTVGGVYRDFPTNTLMKNAVYVHADRMKGDRLGWMQLSNICYVVLDDAANREEVIQHFYDTFDWEKAQIPKETIDLRLSRLTDLYYLHDSAWDDGEKGQRSTTYLLGGIACLILLIAIINFINFATALAPLRIKRLNTQMVLGCSPSYLRISLVMEAVLLSVVAFGLALLLVHDLAYTPFHDLLSTPIRLASHPEIVALTAVTALLTGIVAGIYPSIYMTSFSPALVLKGSFGLSPKGKQFRMLLTGFQYTISILLIIAALFVQLQNRFMLEASAAGFDTEQVAIVELTESVYSNHKDTYVNKLKSYNGIDKVAFSLMKFASSDQYLFDGGEVDGKPVYFSEFIVSPEFLSAMGFTIREGRDFTSTDEVPGNRKVIFNASAQKAFGVHAGDSFSGREIVGIMDDFRFASCREQIKPFAFTLYNPLPGSYPPLVSYIRFHKGVDLQAAVRHIRETLAEIDPYCPFEIEFFDSLFNHLYRKEQTLNKQITLFSLIAMILSMAGVFGLVLFETQYRRREIAIRKVNGAQIGDILWMFNRIYIRILGVSFLIASPIAWYLVRQWLNNFAYQTPLRLWVFAAAFGLILLITVCTITFRNWKAANENPVRPLQSE